MDLDKIRITTRPRTTEEAIDLGFVMARHWWRPLMLSWLMVALPLFVVFHLVFIKMPIVAGILIWLCKPLYEQAPLYLLSRALFAEKTALKDIAKNIRTIAGKQLFANLIWRRLSFRRSFNAAVSQLEGLKGADRKRRINTLHGNKPSGGWLTFICIHLELVFYISFFALIAVLVPPEFDVNTFDLMSEESFWVTLLQNTLYFCAIAIVAPFYIASGFSLYLHRRIELEAWDIELNFRKIQTRLNTQSSMNKVASMTAIALLCSLLVAYPGTPAQAAEEEVPISDQSHTLPTKASAQIQIKEILEDKVFGYEETRTVWRKKNQEEENEDEDDNLSFSWLKDFAQALAVLGEVIFWIAIGAALVFLIYTFPKWSQWFGISSLPKVTKKQQAPDTLFGLDVRPESLPDDVAAEAWQLCQSNQMRAALSLLYRATLIALMNQHNIEFYSGATEGECLKIVQLKQLNELGDYFHRLTHTWQSMAYGHLPPSQEQMKQLCDAWHIHVQRKAETA